MLHAAELLVLQAPSLETASRFCGRAGTINNQEVMSSLVIRDLHVSIGTKEKMRYKRPNGAELS